MTEPDTAALNGGSGNSTTPKTTQNRCYPSDSEAAATGGDDSGNGFYVGQELVTWWEELDGVRYKGETLIVRHGNQRWWIHMGCDRPKCATCNSHGFGSYPT